MTAHRNRLADETSPYLLQHCSNPVDWYPWGEEALQRARDEDKPILLSVGYSACHWCHVMAHESFEDEATAALMNQGFINIKVDREERPDLDKIYQLAHQVLTRQGGGWPLTVFLTPADQTPFFAGTYFPPDDRYGRPSFRSVLQSIESAYRHKRDEIEQQNQSLQDYLRQINQSRPRDVELTDNLFAALAQQLLAEFDSTYGGFTPRPKFPHAYFIERGLRQFRRYGQGYSELLQAALFSAEKMAEGGLFDQIGGGFCRYSTDEMWMIPHFEKMLYDNGQLLPLYAWCWQLRPQPWFERAVTLSADWLMREMQSDAGGFYSAQDADSEGEEGKYYVWQRDDVAELLPAEDFAVFSQVYGLDRKPNFEGQWYPHVFESPAQVAGQVGSSEQEIVASLERSRQCLLQARLQRIKPGTDDKILTSWNALIIRGLLVAGRVFDQPDYAVAATRALDFLRRELWSGDHLCATWKEGRARLNAYLDDHAYLLLAIIEALQWRWSNDLLAWARQLADRLIDQFADTEAGGFFFTSHDHETLIMRSRTFNDDALPSGNAIAAQALYYLGYLCAEPRYLDYAERTVSAAALQLAQQPMGFAAMFNALDVHLHSATVIVLRGQDDVMSTWRRAVETRYLPDVLCFAIDSGIEPPVEIADKRAIGDGVTAYVCEGMTCREPVQDLDAFVAMLDGLYPA